MTCPDGETLSAYADGELHGALKAEIAAHLAQCRTCAEEVRRFEEVAQAARDAIAAIPVEGAPPALTAPMRTMPVGWKVLRHAAAAAILLAAVGFFAWQLYRKPGTPGRFAREAGTATVTRPLPVPSDERATGAATATSETQPPRARAYTDSVWEQIKRSQRARDVAMRVYGIGRNGAI